MRTTLADRIEINQAILYCIEEALERYRVSGQTVSNIRIGNLKYLFNRERFTSGLRTVAEEAITGFMIEEFEFLEHEQTYSLTIDVHRVRLDLRMAGKLSSIIQERRMMTPLTTLGKK